MIIWALYDDANGSWNKLNIDGVKILSIGINKNNWDNYYQLDLSVQNENLIKQLTNLPKPDIIVASPPCESWSVADNQQRLWRKQEKNHIEIFTKDNIENNNKNMHKNRKRDYFKQWRTTLNGISTALATYQIINHFQPYIYIVENPQSSKIWEFFRENVKFQGIYNLAYYNNYDSEFSRKPTTFMSNIELNLLHKMIPGKKMEQVYGYKRRSSIPQKLLEDIINEIKFKK